MSIDVTEYVTIENLESVFTWRHGGLIGVPKQWNGGHFGVPSQPCGSWTLFLCKRFVLFQLICIETGHPIGNFLTLSQGFNPFIGDKVLGTILAIFSEDWFPFKKPLSV